MNDSKNMTSLEAATSAVSLKLNKRGNQAIWAFDIKGVVSLSCRPSLLRHQLTLQSQHSGRPMQLSHEIDVHVLSQKRQSELNEPLCPPPDVSFVFPRCSPTSRTLS